MLRREKFSKKSLWALSSRNWTREGIESKEDAPEQRGFRGGEDLRLGAIEQTNRERDRQAERYQHIKIKDKEKKNGTYAWKMHENVTCKKKEKKIHGLSPIQSY